MSQVRTPQYFSRHLLFAAFYGAGAILAFSAVTGYGNDIPGTNGITRYQVAKQLVECDGADPMGTCIVELKIVNTKTISKDSKK